MNGISTACKLGFLHHRTLPRGAAGRGLAVSIIALAATVGCIERTVTINTEPQGARVFLNDEEVGRSPVKVPFTWYGDYDIIVRKEGHQTLQTNRRLHTPWYEMPGIDFFTECLMPFTVHDDHVIETLVLEQSSPPSRDALLENAEQMRAQSDAPPS